MKNIGFLRRCGWVVCTFLLVLLLLGAANAQVNNSGALPSTGGAGIGGWFPFPTSLGSLDLANIRIMPYARVGYQKMTVGFNLPSSWNVAGVPGPNTDSSIELQIKDANAWIGAIGAEARVLPSLLVFLNLEANAARRLEANTSPDPLVGSGYPAVNFNPAIEPITWTGTKFQWWCIDAGGAYEVRNNFAFLAGLKVAHFSLDLDDPRDRFGNELNWRAPLSPFESIQYSADADLQAKIWIPYIGLSVTSPRFRATFLWSPFASARIRIPEFGTQILSLVIPHVFHIDEELGIGWYYSAFSPGAYLEAFMEYDHRVTEQSFVKIWGRAQWLNIRGKADLAVQYGDVVTGSVGPLIETAPTTTEGNTCSFTQYGIAGGVSGGLIF